MKTLLLASLMTLTALSTNKVQGTERAYSEYKGKAPMALTYLGTGWSDAYFCNHIPLQTVLPVSGGGVLGATVAVITGATVGPLMVAGIVGVEVWNIIECTDTSKIKQGVFNIHLSASVSESSEERVTISLKTKKTNKCAGFALNVLGESDGFGNYELYVNKEAYLENKSLGTATQSGKKLHLNFTEPMVLITKGKKGFDCRWDLTDGLNAELKK